MVRPYNFGLYLKKYGYKVRVFSASFLHGPGKNLIKDRELYIEENKKGLPFVFIRTPGYRKNDLRRVWNMLAYYRNLLKVGKLYFKEYEKPNLIIASSPHPLVMLAGINLARDFNIPCICEIRDFWPEVFFMNNTIKEDSLLARALVKGEHWLYKNADGIIFLKEGDPNYLKDRKWDKGQGGSIDLDKCYYINNGVDLEKFDREKEKYKIQDPDLEAGKFNLVYTGAIRQVNNIGNILDTAKLLREYKDIQFLVYGEGDQLGRLRERVIDEGIDNVKMKGYVEQKYIPSILTRSSVNLLNYSQDKYNWSRGNSSNKLFEYMASARPIISTVKMGYCYLEKYDCGLSLDQDRPEDLAQAIIKIYQMDRTRYKEIGENARKGSKDFDYKILTRKLINLIEEYIG